MQLIQNWEKARFKKAKQVQWKAVEGQAVILQFQTGNYFALDPVGTFLWSKVNTQSKSFQELIDALRLEYDCSKEQAHQDTLEFCGQLVAEKLLEVQE